MRSSKEGREQHIRLSELRTPHRCFCVNNLRCSLCCRLFAELVRFPELIMLVSPNTQIPKWCLSLCRAKDRIDLVMINGFPRNLPLKNATNYADPLDLAFSATTSLA